MSNLGNALQELRLERKQAQEKVQRLDGAIGLLEELIEPRSPHSTTNAVQPGHKVSAASRKRMAAAQKARWAKVRAARTTAASKTAAPKKRTMSVEARKKIAAYQRAKWAKIRAQQKKAA